MTFREYLKNNKVYLDGGMGTLLQERGLRPGERPELWNISHRDIIVDIHRAYFDAGSNVVSANTFGANVLHFELAELDTIIQAAVANAREAANLSIAQGPKFVALDIGPTGKLLKPLGDLDFEDAVELFAKTVRIGVQTGVDLVIIETMNDSYETKAALLAVKENSDLPVIVSNAYGRDGKLMTGATPTAMVAMAEGMGADVIGANCSLGPAQLMGVAQELISVASIPVVIKPNAGLPHTEGNKTVFDVGPEEFAKTMAEIISMGVRVAGGCCGTTPAHIAKMVDETKDISAIILEDKGITMVSSYTHAVIFKDEPILIGERINPTGKKRFKQALVENDMDYILTEGLRQQEKGVHILDVNVGFPEIDEVDMLTRAVCELQTVTDLPLQIDTADTVAMESALRRYNGKAMINSVNGKTEVMDAIFPLVKKYGGLVVALTLDESGIPSTAEGRIQIAKNILAKAQEFGISPKDIIFDTLAMTVSADNKAAVATLDSLCYIKNQLGCHTSLGVSNISFGLPNRDAVNGVFFAMALERGLSAAIMNPYSNEMLKTYYAYKMLGGMDENCAQYISMADSFGTVVSKGAANTAGSVQEAMDLRQAIIKGLKEMASQLTKERIGTVDPLEIVNQEIIPALNYVGQGFEQKTMYLPQLLMSAEAAKSAFQVIKEAMPKGGNNKGTCVLATVKGDIHDIGKNIVKLLMENYGFTVVDLGKDVPPKSIVDKVVELHAPMMGLSALMTTTVPAMEETIVLVREKAPWCKVIVGGAVLTQEYADKIGADKYASDAMEAVRYAEKLCAGE